MWSPRADGGSTRWQALFRADILTDLSPADYHAQRLLIPAMQKSVCGRPGLHRSNLVTYLLGVTAPIDQAMLLGQLRRLGRLALFLGHSVNGAGRELADDLQSQLGSQRRQSRFQLSRRLFGTNVD